MVNWELLTVAVVLINALVEVIKQIADYKSLQVWYIGSIVVGVLVCVGYNIDLFALVGLQTDIPYLGAVLSGLLLGRGSNFVADLFKKLNGR